MMFSCWIELWKKLLLLFVNLATYLREDFRESFATTVWAFAEHMGKQELSRPFRGESGGAYLRPKALLFVHCKENRRRLAVSGGHVFFVLLLVVCRSVRRRWPWNGAALRKTPMTCHLWTWGQQVENVLKLKRLEMANLVLLTSCLHTFSSFQKICLRLKSVWAPKSVGSPAFFTQQLPIHWDNLKVLKENTFLVLSDRLEFPQC